jgi:hypothetical protein
MSDISSKNSIKNLNRCKIKTYKCLIRSREKYFSLELVANKSDLSQKAYKKKRKKERGCYTKTVKVFACSLVVSPSSASPISVLMQMVSVHLEVLKLPSFSTRLLGQEISFIYKSIGKRPITNIIKKMQY